MYPTIFHIPLLHIPIYGYGLMMVFAFLSTQWLASKLAVKKGIDPEIFVNVALFALVSGVIGSRMSHVLENLAYYTNPKLSAWDNFLTMINIRSGGLTFYGGLILAAPVVLGYLMYRKVPARLAMDICAPLHHAGFGNWPCWMFSEWLLATVLRAICPGRCSSLTTAMRMWMRLMREKLIRPAELRIPTVDGRYRLASNEELSQGVCTDRRSERTQNDVGTQCQDDCQPFSEHHRSIPRSFTARSIRC